jgi:uncharacterized membrane-anchored protein YhcB (DUF1043 family)
MPAAPPDNRTVPALRLFGWTIARTPDAASAAASVDPASRLSATRTSLGSMRSLMLAMFFGVAVMLAYAMAKPRPAAGAAAQAGPFTVLGVAIMVAGAALMLGVMMGFLFGIPKARQEGAQNPSAPAGPAPGAAGAREERDERRYQANTNLEQISDWLTKILVGVGLTQIGSLPQKIEDTAGYVARGMGGTAADEIFAGGVILYYTIAGFFFGYLWARLFLPRAFRQADLTNLEDRVDETQQGMVDAQQKLEETQARLGEMLTAAEQTHQKVEETSKRAEAAARAADAAADAISVQVTQPTAPAPPPQPPEDGDAGERAPFVATPVPAALDSYFGTRVEPGTAHDDPWKGAFGGAAEADGRALDARFVKVEGDLASVELSVRSADPGRPLGGVVQFFLHPTFPNWKPVVSVRTDGVARLPLAGLWGGFTVGALADGGATRLELDLAELPGAPEFIKTR